MAKKAELYAELKQLDKKTKLTEKNTIAEIEAAIAKLGVPAVIASEAKQSSDNDLDRHAEQSSARDDSEEHYAKSGKRSKKHEDEIQAEEAKEERKAAHDTTPQGDTVAEAKKGPAPKTRPKTERKGKNYRKLVAKIDKTKAYPLAEAMKLAVETANTKFDSTVELHIRLGVDPKLADQNIRATVTLPHGTGKNVRVAAFVPADDVEAAQQAGADLAGEQAITSELDKENLNFDVLVATPTLMPKLGKYARLLGPRGLMPNPKSGTVSTNPAQAVKDAKGGKVEYRVDKQSIIHLGIGKVSFGADKLTANAKSLIEGSLIPNKPTSLKGPFILSISTSTTMGPSIRVENA
jgi:large subunit ribosomal protein L1